MIDVKVGQTYRKRALPRSTRTKPENRGVHSVVRVTRIDKDIVSLRVISGPDLFARRMRVVFLVRDFDLIEEKK